MTMVRINGEELEVTVDAPGAALADACAEALKLHRGVCRGVAARERADRKASVTTIKSGHFGFTAPEVSEVEEESEAEDVLR